MVRDLGTIDVVAVDDMGSIPTPPVGKLNLFTAKVISPGKGPSFQALCGKTSDGVILIYSEGHIYDPEGEIVAPEM